MEKKLIAVLESICAVFLVVLTFSVAFQILAREVFHIAATWTTQIGRLSFTAIVFLGVPILVLENGQMVVTIVKDAFAKNKPVALVFEIAADLVGYFFIITMIYGCYRRMVSDWNTVIPTVEWLSTGHTYLIMLIGSVSMLVAKVIHTKKYIQAFRAKEEEN